eukprot:Lithocolla_globosa_v1_NODE_4860_length_1350_cov_34.330502.p2 type:complete len:141 gc:universal NODE_4860_length_1350_cov_34.330502:1124-702(-)
MLERKKLVLVGSDCPKRTLLTHFINETTDIPYYPTIVENEVVEITLHPSLLLQELTCWDIPDYDEFSRFRSLYYEGSSVVLLCFDVNSKESFESLRTILLPEIEYRLSGVPLVLCGLIDTRSMDTTNPGGNQLVLLNQKR